MAKRRKHQPEPAMLPESIRDRITELRRVKASEIEGAPWNWRTHDQEQAQAVKASLEELGIIDALKCRQLPDGRYQLFDGHLREEIYQGIGPDTIVPILVTDLSEDEAKKANVIFDPLSAMAGVNAEKLDGLLREVQTGNEALASVLDDLAKDAGIIDAGSANVPDADETIDEQYSVLVKCGNEHDQKAVLAELDRHGLDVRALCVGVPEPEPIEASIEVPPLHGRRIVRQVKVKRTPRVMQMEGMFDVPPSKQSKKQWDVDLDLTAKPWNIGLIVGPSGSGKSTLAREIFGERIVQGWPWPEGESLLDGFPASLSIQEIVALLSSVGFSSPPAWVKPFQVLSNGEQFRVTLARTLAELPELAVVDEFTSVVDRQVAQIGSAAVAKAVRGRNGKFVAVTCHYDVEDWLQPDWKYDVAAGELEWRSLRRRPEVQLSIRRVGTNRWPLYGHHHYLSHTLNRAAICFEASVSGQPAGFTAVLHYPHVNGGWWREHRTVCLPDYQGVGIGNALSEYVASLFSATNKQYRSTTSHPAMIRHRLRSLDWLCTRTPSLMSPSGNNEPEGRTFTRTHAVSRLTASFLYVGRSRPEEAVEFGVL